MVNKAVFSTRKTAPKADTVNDAGGVAYDTGAKHTLAQIACTGTFNGTYYAGGDQVLSLVEKAINQLIAVDPVFVAKVAIYARDKGFMKDLPAYIVAKLADIDKDIFKKVFPKVIDNGKMLRNVITIARSGKLNKRYNLSSQMWRKLLRKWFESRTVDQIFKAAIGNDPTMRDILRMCKPKPESEGKELLFRYLTSYNYQGFVPEPVRSYQRFRSGVDRTKVPKVDFRYLADLGLTTDQWKEVAIDANWTMTRMNLNTFARHGVFEDPKMVQLIADRLRNTQEIKKAKVFPYQLLAACKATEGSVDVPFEIREALQDAMEVAVSNAPVYQGKTIIGIDVSGSMRSPVTGNRGSASSVMQCIDVAALFGAAMLRNNRSATVIPFSDRINKIMLNGRDSVLTNAKTLANLPSGGTDCSLVLKTLNENNIKANAVVYVSDNESWIDSQNRYRTGTGMMDEWIKFKHNNKKARLVLIDLTPTSNSQASFDKDILQVGGFSDNVFNVVEAFLENGHSADHWVNEIDKIEL